MAVRTLDTPQCRQQGSLEAFLFRMRQAAVDTTLQITVDILVGIELRRVRWQVEHLDLVAVACEPCAHLAGVMHPQVVEDKKLLAVAILDETLHESDQPIGVHAPVIDHEPHQTLVADRRDHLSPHPLGRDAGRRGEPPAKKGAVAGQAGLVSPVDDRTLGFRPRLDVRIRLIQPLTNHAGILFQRPLERPLRRQAPARHVAADARQRQLDAELALDQLRDHAPGPQHERKLHLLRRLVRDPAMQLLLLVRRQFALLAFAPTALALMQRLRAARAIAAVPLTDGRRRHATDLRDLHARATAA